MQAKTLCAAAAILFTTSSGISVAETRDTQDPVATVETFLTAMAQRDSAAASAVVLLEGRFTSVREEGGKRVVRSFTNQEDIASWPTRAENVLERIWRPGVRLHGHIAIVTAPYDFYRNSAFSHCGVDVFELVATENGWRISGGVYSVVKQNCPPSPLGPPKFAGR